MFSKFRTAGVRDEYGEDIVELLVETHGYTVGEARRNVERERERAKRGSGDVYLPY